jgi:hypothetical protein
MREKPNFMCYWIVVSIYVCPSLPEHFFSEPSIIRDQKPHREFPKKPKTKTAKSSNSLTWPLTFLVDFHFLPFLSSVREEAKRAWNRFTCFHIFSFHTFNATTDPKFIDLFLEQQLNFFSAFFFCAFNLLSCESLLVFSWASMRFACLAQIGFSSLPGSRTCRFGFFLRCRDVAERIIFSGRASHGERIVISCEARKHFSQHQLPVNVNVNYNGENSRKHDDGAGWEESCGEIEHFRLSRLFWSPVMGRQGKAYAFCNTNLSDLSHSGRIVLRLNHGISLFSRLALFRSKPPRTMWRAENGFGDGPRFVSFSSRRLLHSGTRRIEDSCGTFRFHYESLYTHESGIEASTRVHSRSTQEAWNNNDEAFSLDLRSSEFADT